MKQNLRDRATKVTTPHENDHKSIQFLNFVPNLLYEGVRFKKAIYHVVIENLKRYKHA